MRRYLIRRLIQVVVMLVIMSVVFFLLIHLIPGGPDRVFFSPHTPPEARAHIIQEYGLDKPLYVQYFSYVTQVVQGNFGNSIADEFGKMANQSPGQSQRIFTAASQTPIDPDQSLHNDNPRGILAFPPRNRELRPARALGYKLT